MKERLTKLLDLKSLITIVALGLMAYGFVVDKFDSAMVFGVILMVMQSYFQRKENK